MQLDVNRGFAVQRSLLKSVSFLFGTASGRADKRTECQNGFPVGGWLPIIRVFIVTAAQGANGGGDDSDLVLGSRHVESARIALGALLDPLGVDPKRQRWWTRRRLRRGRRLECFWLPRG